MDIFPPRVLLSQPNTASGITTRTLGSVMLQITVGVRIGIVVRAIRDQVSLATRNGSR